MGSRRSRSLCINLKHRDEVGLHAVSPHSGCIYISTLFTYFICKCWSGRVWITQLVDVVGVNTPMQLMSCTYTAHKVTEADISARKYKARAESVKVVEVKKPLLQSL